MQDPAPTFAPPPPDEHSVGGEPAGVPVGRSGTRVDVSEHPAPAMNGFISLILAIAIPAFAAWRIYAEVTSGSFSDGPSSTLIIGLIALSLAWIVVISGLTIISPGETKVVQFFGRYLGTIRRSGLVMTVPFSTQKKVSVRVHNFETNDLKVNDLDGNPVNIAAIIVWQVADTAKAVFAVEDYAQFVSVQSESALRHVASSHPYDNADEGEETLRGSTEMVAFELAEEVAARITIAGLEVVEARISSLAYAPEIAQAMLQRQQASAVIAAREKIVEGAVSMVENALDRLEENNIVELDDERKAAMVSNLLVVLCSESRTSPVINAGTLY